MKFQLRFENKYTIIFLSFLLGFLFAILGITTAASSIQNLTFDYIGILHIHAYFPFLWVTDALIVVFPLIAYLGSRYLERKRIKIEEVLVLERSKKNKYYNFIEALRTGQITKSHFETTQESDIIVESLEKLRFELNKTREEAEKRDKEDRERHWTTEGLAVFGEHLRSTSNLKELSYLLISKLVNYIEVEQGGFFVVHEKEDKSRHFEQTGSYAYDRKKFCDQIIPWGEGLIGACAIEQKSVYMPEVSDGYVNITSGLGKLNPKVLLIVPLIRDFEVHGLMEFASLNEIPEYKREFLEKLAESIAITLQNIKTERITNKLLKDTQKQADILEKQEDVLRQNMEKMQLLQEEKTKQAEEFISFTNSVNHTLIRAEFRPDGTLLYANTHFIFKLEYMKNSDVENKSIIQFINPKDRKWFGEMWEKLSKGGTHFEGEMKHMTRTGKDLWTMSTYTCVRLPDGTIEKILFLAIDITNQKTEALYHESLTKAINLNSIQAELDLDETIVNANKKFLITLDIPEKQIGRIFIKDLIDIDESIFNSELEKVKSGSTYDSIFKFRSLTDKNKWFRGTFSPIFNTYNEVESIVFLAHDITQQIENDQQLEEQTIQLRQQEVELKSAKEQLGNSLEKAKQEIKQQYDEINDIRILNERTLEGLLDGVITIDNNNKIIFFNKAAEKIWGLEAKDIIEKKLETIIPPTTEMEDYIGEYFFSGTKFIGIRKEVVMINAKGQKVSILLTLSEGKYRRKYTLTAFFQAIEVELF